MIDTRFEHKQYRGWEDGCVKLQVPKDRPMPFPLRIGDAIEDDSGSWNVVRTTWMVSDTDPAIYLHVVIE